MKLKTLFASTALCITNLQSAEIATAPLDKQKQLRDFIDQYKAENQPKKFFIMTGVTRGTSKDKTQPTQHLKAHTTTGILSFGYQFLPNFCANLGFTKSMSTSKTETRKLDVKSTDHTIVTSFAYQILKWLTLDLSFQSKNGRTTTYIPNEPIKDSISKNTHRTPGFSLRMTFPLNKKLFVSPDVGFSRTCMHNKAYVDNAGVNKPKRTLRLDQASTNAKLGFIYNPMVIPYVSVGYSKTLKYSDHLKSKNSFRGGAGAILFGGIVNLDWNASKANGTTIANNFSLNLSAKF